MFLPFLKIVKKTLTRWSQATKKGKIRQTQNNKPPRESNKERQPRELKVRKTSRNFEEKMHQKKPPSHRVIKKSTRRGNIYK